MKQASFSYFILYLRKTPSKRKLPIREKKGATNFSLIRSFDCTENIQKELPTDAMVVIAKH